MVECLNDKSLASILFSWLRILSFQVILFSSVALGQCTAESHICISSFCLSHKLPTTYTIPPFGSNSNMSWINLWISYPLPYLLQVYWFLDLSLPSECYWLFSQLVNSCLVGNTFKIPLDPNTGPPSFTHYQLTSKLLHWSPNWSLFIW